MKCFQMSQFCFLTKARTEPCNAVENNISRQKNSKSSPFQAGVLQCARGARMQVSLGTELRTEDALGEMGKGHFVDRGKYFGSYS